jgi:hypothetical protein
MHELGPVRQVDVQQRIAKVRVLARAALVLDHRGARAGAQLQQVPGVPGEIAIGGCADEYDVERLGDLHALVDSQDAAIVGKRLRSIARKPRRCVRNGA